MKLYRGTYRRISEYENGVLGVAYRATLVEEYEGDVITEPSIVYPPRAHQGNVVEVYGPTKELVKEVVMEMIKREQQLYHLTLNTLRGGVDSATEDDQRQLTR